MNHEDVQPASPFFRKRIVVLLGLLAVVSVAGIWLNRQYPSPHEHPAVGSTLAVEEHLVPIAATNEIVEPDQLTRRVRLLHFWGTWCGPCRMEYPSLVRSIEGDPIASDCCFVSIACAGCPGQSIQEVERQTIAYYQSNGLSVSTYTCGDGKLIAHVSSVLGEEMMMFPTSILVDQDGVVRAVWQGYCSSGIDQKLAALVSLSQL